MRKLKKKKVDIVNIEKGKGELQDSENDVVETQTQAKVKDGGDDECLASSQTMCFLSMSVKDNVTSIQLGPDTIPVRFKLER